MNFDLKPITSSVWSDKFLLTYETKDFDDCERFLTRHLGIRQDLKEKLYSFICSDGYYFLVRLSRKILIKASGYFDYRGYSAQVRTIGTESEWEQIKLYLEENSLTKEERPKEKAVPIWEYDFSNYTGTDIDLTCRAREVMKIIENYHSAPPKVFDPVIVHPPARTTTRRTRKVNFVGKK